MHNHFNPCRVYSLNGESGTIICAFPADKKKPFIPIPYAGEKRNPWSEFECGSNYARSMASYALLINHSGFEYNMHKKHIGFKPIVKGNSKHFWSLDSGWGTVEFTSDTIIINVLYGSLQLKSFSHNANHISRFIINDGVVTVTNPGNTIRFTESVTIIP